jgi:NADPH-dependent 7-cyano-7-deazaguanine reductase QueF
MGNFLKKAWNIDSFQKKKKYYKNCYATLMKDFTPLCNPYFLINYGYSHNV